VENMKNIYLLIILSFLFVACVDEDIVKRETSMEGFTFSVEVPSMLQTRALGKVPTEETLRDHMHLFVFGPDGHYLGSYKATVDNIQAKEDGSAAATFIVPNLRKTAEVKHIVHFVAGDLDELDSSLSTGDTERTAMEKLTVSGEKEAYWQRVELDKGFSDNMKLDSPVKLIRNFCEVRLDPDVFITDYVISTTKQIVNIKGFALVNQLLVGQIAPYNPKNATFINYEGFLEALERTPVEETKRPYKVFYEETGMYDGFEVNDKTLTTVTPSEYTEGAKYLYARNQNNSKKQAYLLLKATVSDAEGTNEKDCYYKIDFTAMDPDNYIVSVMNLYGNFTYLFKIGNINGEGYADVEDAMAAAASNNIASSIEVSETPYITDGLGNSLSVGSLNLMITSTDEYEMEYEYIQNDVAEPSKVQFALYPQDNELIDVSIDTNEKKIKIKARGSKLPDELRTQYVIITTPSGLSRRITVNVRKPFEFLATNSQRYVNRAAGSSVTCIIALPPNLPVSLFPLEIDIQPKQKVIYPDASRNKLPVGTIDWKNFHYKLTVEYNEYRLHNFVNCFFLTNQEIIANETDRVLIDVLCKHFESSQMSFATNRNPYEFKDAKIENALNIPFQEDSSVKLSFTIDEIPDKGQSINIFTNYLTDAEITEGAAGSTIELGRLTQYVFNPSQPGKYEITFKTTHDVVGEDLELTSSDMTYIPQLISYRNPEAKVICQLPNGRTITKGNVISVYNDEYYTEKVTDLIVGGAEEVDDVLHMLSFATYDKEDHVYFQYTDNSVSPVIFYYADENAGKLIENAKNNKTSTVQFYTK
jgi:lipoprotein